MPANPLIEALMDPRRYPHPVDAVTLLETHISWVLLAGSYAYKIKKPVDLGFLDFSTLARRHHFCTEELRLNRRLAPRLYRDVVPICGSAQAPVLDGDGTPFEYAVRMLQFPQEALLDRVLRAGGLTPDHVDAMARGIAGFHAAAEVADAATPYGEPDIVFQPVRENFLQIEPLLDDPAERERLIRLRDWSAERFHALLPRLHQRKTGGWIREGHGDLHLGNMLLDGDAVTAFDCLEFSPELRWIDVQSDLAFLLMDLEEHGADAYARRLLDGYLAHGGDYAGVALQPFYRVYRALVRAKVAAIRLAQSGGPADELHAYLALAERLMRPRPPFLLVMHGLSGSGKSFVAQGLVERLGAVRLRSDVERKRLLGREAASVTPEAAKAEVYGEELTARTYARLLELAREVLGGGTPAIVDATCLKRDQRAPFLALAGELGVPCRLLDVQAPDALLAERVARRAAAGHDPSEADLAVVELQRAGAEPLDDAERARTLGVDGAAPEFETLVSRISHVVGAMD